IHGPAAPDVWLWVAAVSENMSVMAPSVFEGVGQNGHSVEGPVVIDGPGDLAHGAIIPCHPSGVESRSTEGVEYTPEKIGLCCIPDPPVRSESGPLDCPFSGIPCHR